MRFGKFQIDSWAIHCTRMTSGLKLICSLEQIARTVESELSTVLAMYMQNLTLSNFLGGVAWHFRFQCRVLHFSSSSEKNQARQEQDCNYCIFKLTDPATSGLNLTFLSSSLELDNSSHRPRTLVSMSDFRIDQEPDKTDKMPASEPVEEFVYRDLSPGRLSPVSSSRALRFPSKLEAMLSNPKFAHVVSWMPHGRSWKVHNIHMFVKQVVPGFFEYNNYKRFIRLVNAWGFRCILKGPDRKSYYHEVRFRAKNRVSPVAYDTFGLANLVCRLAPRFFVQLLDVSS